MAISETKMQIVIDNYFKDECDVNTSIKQAFEKGFRIGVKKGASINRPQGEWIDVWQDGICSWRGTCSVCRSTNDIPPPFEANYCPNCGAKMKGASDE